MTTATALVHTDTGPGRGYAPFRLTERFEAALGDERDPDVPFSTARCVRLDERAEFPSQICAQLDHLQLYRWYVHTRDGGELSSYEDLLQIIRLLSRRDLTAALAHGKTYLGSVSTWLAGSAELRARLAGQVLAGQPVSFALTERAHGSDLLATEVVAEHRDDGGYRLRGEKWLINNATRGSLICVLARTGTADGPRALSLLLVDKRELPLDRFRCLPKAETHGVRSADISGIEYLGAEVSADALIGAEGAGLEIALKAFQVTRTLCAGMSLGVLDKALRVATGFAEAHLMYGRALIELPHAARTLTEAYADLLMLEAVGLVATRGIHTLPGELSVTSAAVKYLVPTTTDRTITELGQVLGARAMFTELYADGAFQKLERDHRIVGIFDGNTLVNLASVVNQFPFLVRGFRNGTVDEGGLEAACGLTDRPPEFDSSRLDLVAHNGSSLVQCVPSAVGEVVDLAARGDVPAEFASLATELGHLVAALHEQMAAWRPSRDVPARVFELARRYTVAVAAGAVLRFYLDNRDREDVDPVLWADARWARAALIRLLRHLCADPERDGEVFDALLPALRAQYADRRLFSLLPCQLSGGQS